MSFQRNSLYAGESVILPWPPPVIPSTPAVDIVDVPTVDNIPTFNKPNPSGSSSGGGTVVVGLGLVALLFLALKYP